MHKSLFKAEIWKRIKRRLKMRYGNTIMVSVAVLVVVNGIAYIALIRSRGIETANQDIILPLAITIGAEALFLMILLLYWRYYEIPEDIFTEQSRREEQFWPKDLDILVSEAGTSDTVSDNGKIVRMLILEVKNGSKTQKIVELDARMHIVAQSSIEPETDIPMTVRFFPDEILVWQDNQKQVSMRPDERLPLVLAFQRWTPPVGEIRFGDRGFSNHLFDREAIYQVEIHFLGRMQSETEFKRFYDTRTIYCHPAEGKFCFGSSLGRSTYDNVPEALVKVVSIAEEGHWLDYSSPFHRQQEQKQKEAREAEPKKQERSRKHKR